jgi:hypothetical protein
MSKKWIQHWVMAVLADWLHASLTQWQLLKFLLGDMESGMTMVSLNRRLWMDTKLKFPTTGWKTATPGNWKEKIFNTL